MGFFFFFKKETVFVGDQRMLMLLKSGTGRGAQNLKLSRSVRWNLLQQQKTLLGVRWCPAVLGLSCGRVKEDQKVNHK